MSPHPFSPLAACVFGSGRTGSCAGTAQGLAGGKCSEPQPITHEDENIVQLIE